MIRTRSGAAIRVLRGGAPAAAPGGISAASPRRAIPEPARAPGATRSGASEAPMIACAGGLSPAPPPQEAETGEPGAHQGDGGRLRHPRRRTALEESAAIRRGDPIRLVDGARIQEADDQGPDGKAGADIQERSKQRIRIVLDLRLPQIGLVQKIARRPGI